MNKNASKRVGFLVTGSEITAGEIINSNSADMAAIMQEWGMNLGEHLICNDRQANIKASLIFLLSRHDAVITIGGLGPTSDDVTRLAVAEVTHQKLIFNESSWQKIVARFAKRNILAIPENNRQQAFFPAQATILPNPNGTADACFLETNEKYIFMLPGPPSECLPLFKNGVLPHLQEHGFQSSLRLFRWRLLGIGESNIAEKLEQLETEYNLEFAYRAHYPFIDVKLILDPYIKFHSKILAQVEMIVQPYFVTHLNIPLTQQLIDFLKHSGRTLFIEDLATKGYFLQKISTIQTESLLLKNSHPNADFYIEIKGLENFWTSKPDQALAHFEVNITHRNKVHYFESDVLLRGQETLEFVSEFVAWKILSFA
ncbi:MAG: competence/damage-inducible protein A [Gammaproteobacteria bacterium]|nr:competence/damage-inducible protein A [Gammaproteobacteria bacterium]